MMHFIKKVEIQQMVLFGIFWILSMLNILSLSIKILKCNKWPPKNWGQNATNPIGFIFCNLKKGNQVSQVGTNFLVPAPTFWSHCQQIVYLKSIESKTNRLFNCFEPYIGNLWSKL